MVSFGLAIVLFVFMNLNQLTEVIHKSFKSNFLIEIATQKHYENVFYSYTMK